jgi:N4-(beta-N-acetylglucosaminyl)-L-asparaginase
MKNRRNFLKRAALMTATLPWACTAVDQKAQKRMTQFGGFPLVISTWAPNTAANALAYQKLESGGSLLDAVEAGIKVAEADPLDTSVGYGGFPDRAGKVVLDAAIMDHRGEFGSVMGLENYKHPISVARKVLEVSNHVYLCGEGAAEFAQAQGFEEEALLTETARQAWEEWVEKGAYDPLLTTRQIEERIKENHDTIGLLVMDTKGDIAGGCSTSGLAFKARGRVGDSPIIGAGLFVDNEIGAATATGIGEEIAKVCGAHVIVEMMRQGMSPTEACREAVMRIVRKDEAKAREMQVCFIAVNKRGEYGGFAMRPEFTYAVHNKLEGVKVLKAPSVFT